MSTLLRSTKKRIPFLLCAVALAAGATSPGRTRLGVDFNNCGLHVPYTKVQTHGEFDTWIYRCEIPAWAPPSETAMGFAIVEIPKGKENQLSEKFCAYLKEVRKHFRQDPEKLTLTGWIVIGRSNGVEYYQFQPVRFLLEKQAGTGWVPDRNANKQLGIQIAQEQELNRLSGCLMSDGRLTIWNKAQNLSHQTHIQTKQECLERFGICFGSSTVPTGKIFIGTKCFVELPGVWRNPFGEEFILWACQQNGYGLWIIATRKGNRSLEDNDIYYAPQPIVYGFGVQSDGQSTLRLLRSWRATLSESQRCPKYLPSKNIKSGAENFLAKKDPGSSSDGIRWIKETGSMNFTHLS